MEFDDTNIERGLSPEEHIEIGLELSEWKKTKIGNLVQAVIRAKMVSTAFDISRRKGDSYVCDDLLSFARKAGFVEALEWVLSDWDGRINKGKRLSSELDASSKT